MILNLVIRTYATSFRKGGVILCSRDFAHSSFAEMVESGQAHCLRRL